MGKGSRLFPHAGRLWPGFPRRPVSSPDQQHCPSPPAAPGSALTRVLQLPRRLGRALEARRIEVAPFVLGRRPVPRTAVPAAVGPRLRGRQGQRRPRAFALGALDAEEPRHDPRARGAAAAAGIAGKRAAQSPPRAASRHPGPCAGAATPLPPGRRKRVRATCRARSSDCVRGPRRLGAVAAIAPSGSGGGA